MRRRDFMQLAAANLAWLGLGGFRASALKLRSALRPVKLHAQIGDLFPPLDLVHRIRDCKDEKACVMLGESGTAEVLSTCGRQRVYLGLRMTGIDPIEHQGNLQSNAQRAVMRRIKKARGASCHEYTTFVWSNTLTTIQRRVAYIGDFK